MPALAGHLRSFEPSAKPIAVTAVAGVDIAASLYGELRIRIYDAAGPFIKVAPDIQVHATRLYEKRSPL